MINGILALTAGACILWLNLVPHYFDSFENRVDLPRHIRAGGTNFTPIQRRFGFLGLIFVATIGSCSGALILP